MIRTRSDAPARRALTAVLCACALPAALAACGGDDGAGDSGKAGAAAPKDVKIAYIVKFGTVPYFVQEAKGAKEKAKQLGVKLTVQDVEEDANKALSSVDNALGTGVNGIMTVVPDQKIGPAVLAKASAKKVPVVAIDGKPVGDGKPGPQTQRLRQLYLRLAGAPAAAA